MSKNEPLHVLVVEDDADTRQNLADVLELDEYQVDSAASAEELLRERDWSQISVVILDRKLPDGTAEELLPKLRKIAPHAAVIVATGYADVNGAISAIRNGAADYLIKPIQVDILRATIARIVERRDLAREKERHQDALRAILETSPCMIVILRFDHRIVYFSPFAEKLTGYTAHDVFGQDFYKLFLPEEKMPLEDVLVRQHENEVRCHDGSFRSIVWNANQLHDYDGAVAVLAVGLDITERKRSEERALQAQRLAAIGETMTGLAHESRNALQRSTACLEMLALEVEDRPEALDLVCRIQRAQRDLQQLYEEVRQYAAPLKLNRAKTDLGRSWRETWADLATIREGRGLELIEEIAAADLTCCVDRFALGQVWRNILENAIHVSPAGGRITVICSDVNQEGLPALRIVFRDQGPGLTADQRKRIFEPFFTTKTKGTGLGMAIAQRIVHSHGGNIEVGTRSTSGAEIIVTIPRGE